MRNSVRNACVSPPSDIPMHPQRPRSHSDELLSRMNSSTSASSPQVPPSFDFGDRSTFPVPPPLERAYSLLMRACDQTIPHSVSTSSHAVLSRVQAFLPELAASNADLLRRAREDPDSIDIENIDESQAQYIEMVSFPPFLKFPCFWFGRRSRLVRDRRFDE